MKRKIPIFLASDANYLPYLSVTVKSIDEQGSDKNLYDVYILGSSFTEEEHARLSALELHRTRITVIDMRSTVSGMRSALSLRLRDYYSEGIFYRLFIADMFPELDRAVYIDCDTVLVSDVAELYDVDMGDNILAAVADESIPCVPEFCDYVENWVGVPVSDYINSGVLVMNLDEYRRAGIFRRFAEFIYSTNPETVAPDQDYLNALCHGRIHYLGGEWNKQPKPHNPTPVSNLKLIHYNLYTKPWRFSDVLYSECFWDVASRTPFYEEIKQGFDTYTDAEREADERGGVALVCKAAELAERGHLMLASQESIARATVGGEPR